MLDAEMEGDPRAPVIGLETGGVESPMGGDGKPLLTLGIGRSKGRSDQFWSQGKQGKARDKANKKGAGLTQRP